MKTESDDRNRWQKDTHGKSVLYHLLENLQLVWSEFVTVDKILSMFLWDVIQERRIA